MNERRRLLLATAISMLLHGALFAFLCLLAAYHPTPPPPEPIKVTFKAPPQRQRQLIETYTPSETPPENADLISDQNTQAADKELKEGATPGPNADIEDTSKLLATSAPPTPPPPQPPSEPETTPEEKSDKADQSDKSDRSDKPAKPKKPTKADTRTPKASPAPPDPEMQLAMAPPIPPTPPAQGNAPGNPDAPAADTPQLSHGDLDNAVINKGFTNFEAIEDDIAPYLLEIRKSVERRWNEALLTHYTGNKPTKAQVDCAIRPDGTLEMAKVVGMPDQPVFASLCRLAIERAGPFRPFPFEVPDMYRNKNLEIRWTFNFLLR